MSTPFGQADFEWIEWKDFPHVSVFPTSGSWGLEASPTSMCSMLNVKMDEFLLRDIHRAFIFFPDEDSALCEPLISSFQDILQYEIFHEIVLKGEMFSYKYFGLNEFVEKWHPQVLHVLSLSPSRTLLAKKFGLYLNEG